MITFKELYSNLEELKKVNCSKKKTRSIRMKKLAKSSAFKKESGEV